MYQVVKLYGNVEPWWFLDGWKDDIVMTKEFDDYYSALKFYTEEWMKLFQSKQCFKSKGTGLSAFWDKHECLWCEECVDYLQQYHSLALLFDWEKLPNS